MFLGARRESLPLSFYQVRQDRPVEMSYQFQSHFVFPRKQRGCAGCYRERVIGEILEYLLTEPKFSSVNNEAN